MAKIKMNASATRNKTKDSPAADRAAETNFSL
jgi:hypothetical protein